jgi:RNA polymerase sigma-70 factor (ECF subfamily)
LTGSEGHDTVAAAIRGDSDAVRALWQENRRWVAAVLLAHKPRQAELEDLLQDVAMTFVRTISRLRDEAMFRPWLRTVAINAARAAGRSTKRQRAKLGWRITGEDQKDDGGAAAPPGEEPAHTAEQHEESGRLTRLAARLPEGYREPLILKAVRGMSYRQIGALMGLPETTIETRIARGRRMLREMALAEGEGAGGIAGFVRGKGEHHE